MFRGQWQSDRQNLGVVRKKVDAFRSAVPFRRDFEDAVLEGKRDLVLEVLLFRRERRRAKKRRDWKLHYKHRGQGRMPRRRRRGTLVRVPVERRGRGRKMCAVEVFRVRQGDGGT